MSFLYKYLPPDRSSYLSDALLRFTPPSALNDPFECLPGYNEDFEKRAIQILEKKLVELPDSIKVLSRNERRIAKRQYEKNMRIMLNKYKSNPKLLMDYFYSKATNSMDKNLGILSLSERWDSALMWSHYTSSHQGFCIGFNREHDFFSNSNTKAESGDFTVMPVSYSDKRPNLLIDRKPNKAESFEILHTKSLDWEYEQEVRAISTFKDATKVVVMEPFNLSLFHVPHDSIGEIIVGLRSNDELFDNTFELAKNLSVPLFRAKMSSQSFDLDRELVSF